MLSPRDILRKIRTVRNIQQICRAMKTVSSIKLRKAQEAITAASPYADALREIVSQLSCGGECAHPLLLTHSPAKYYGIVAISSDKGMAGSYNANLIRTAASHIHEKESVVVFPIGRKVTDTFRRTNVNIDTSISPLGNPSHSAVSALADHIGDLYVSGKLDHVDLIYTRFGSGINTIQLLPIIPPEDNDGTSSYIFEPSPEVIIESILPRYLRTVLFTAILSSVAAEHAARVASMSLATENADELIDRLTMEYNKSRQSGITSDLTDIVGAAEALR